MRLPLAWCVLGVVHGAALGCDEESVPLEARCARSDTRECGGGLFCPRGTRCFYPDETDAAIPDCRVDTGDVNPHVLTLGFNVSEFPLARALEATGRFEVRIPRSAQFINCAVFICEPSVWPVDARAAVDNFAECTYAHRVFDVRDFGGDERVTSIDLNTLERPGSDGASCDADSEFRAKPPMPVVSRLQLGCLAFDDRRVIRATRLLELTPSDVPAASTLPPLVLGDCAAADMLTDGQNCYPNPSGGYGTCSNGQCRRRCLDSRDCDSNASASSEGSCVQLDPASLGLCILEATDAR
jgi:hypothetical protein